MKNLFAIFVSPVETFQRVKEIKTAWIIPLVALILFSVILVYLQMPILEQTMLDSFKSQQGIDPATYDALIAGSKMMSWITAPLFAAAGIFIMALLFMLLNLIVRGEAKYMQLVSLAGYAAMPGLVGGLITGIMLFVSDAKSLTDVTLSLGAFLTEKSGVLYHLLTLANPFGIWELALYVVGASVIMNRPRKTVGIWIVGVWLVFGVGSALLV